ncbi:diguanylate cyclase [Naasia sp. SYSU D00948]|uniref:sensor domain-containing protein n=1 Tax=Naasia sp. SYSU D00948 TaxID=2817379 RepID=UPI001B317FFE|nr:diguanylate cyclase [Naasia sp. SYSU D00948]
MPRIPPEDLYEHAPCGLLVTSPDGTVLHVNRTLLDWTGHPEEEVRGRPFDALLTTGSRLFAETRYRPVLALQGEVRELALRLRRADGEDFPVLVNAITSTTPEGDAVVRLAVFETTQRHDYERELLAARREAERSEAHVRVLQDAATLFGETGTRAAVAEALADVAGRALDAAPSAVLLLQGGDLQVAGGSHPAGHSVSLGKDGPELRALREGVAALRSLEEVESQFPRLAPVFRAARVEAESVTVLLEDGAAAGVLACFFGRRREFDDHTLDLQAALCRLAGQALTRIALQRTLRELALQDPLTGLPNRALLQDRVADAVVEAGRSGRSMALVFVDLDGFKSVNDRFGHHVGDLVLEEVGKRLGGVIRRSDTIGRLGGDEFMVVCADTDARAATRVAQRISEALRAPIPGVPEEMSITASVGVAVHVPLGDMPVPVEELIRSADQAMYEAKRSGKDRTKIVTVPAGSRRAD